MKIGPFLHKLKSIKPRHLYKLLSLRVFDELLYSMDTNGQTYTINKEMSIERFSYNQSSGLERIDKRSTPFRECYLARIDGVVVHESWLFFDVLLPAQFGFDSDIPVIGECVTYPQFRGRNIYPQVLRYIVADLNQRKICKKVFILVSPLNKPSIRGIERAGFNLLGRLRGKKILGFTVNKDFSKSNSV